MFCPKCGNELDFEDKSLMCRASMPLGERRPIFRKPRRITKPRFSESQPISVTDTSYAHIQPQPPAATDDELNFGCPAPICISIIINEFNSRTIERNKNEVVDFHFHLA